MNVLLFQSQRGRALPVLEHVDQGPVALPEGAGRWERLKKNVRLFYDGLKEKLDYYEKVCTDLREVRSLRIAYAPKKGEAEAGRLLRGFLESRRAHHRRWLHIDIVLAVLGGFLMPLPGPNLFFFYPAARAWGHLQARRGAESALAATWEFQPDSRISSVQDSIGRLEAAARDLSELERTYGLRDLEKRLRAKRNR